VSGGIKRSDVKALAGIPRSVEHSATIPYKAPAGWNANCTACPYWTGYGSQRRVTRQIADHVRTMNAQQAPVGSDL